LHVADDGEKQDRKSRTECFSSSGATQFPGLRVAYAITAVGFAPFAEEYLFRRPLYRALDREWGGWRAVLGAAAFLTVYHPLLAWPPFFVSGPSIACCSAGRFRSSFSGSPPLGVRRPIRRSDVGQAGITFGGGLYRRPSSYCFVTPTESY